MAMLVPHLVKLTCDSRTLVWNAFIFLDFLTGYALTPVASKPFFCFGVSQLGATRRTTASAFPNLGRCAARLLRHFPTWDDAPHGCFGVSQVGMTHRTASSGFPNLGRCAARLLRPCTPATGQWFIAQASRSLRV